MRPAASYRTWQKCRSLLLEGSMAPARPRRGNSRSKPAQTRFRRPRVDILERRDLLATISGQVWLDDGDGIHENDELGQKLNGGVQLVLSQDDVVGNGDDVAQI